MPSQIPNYGKWSLGANLTDDLVTVYGTPSDGAVGLLEVTCDKVETGYSVAVKRDDVELYRFRNSEPETITIVIAAGQTYVEFFDGSLPTAPVSFETTGHWVKV